MTCEGRRKCRECQNKGGECQNNIFSCHNHVNLVAEVVVK